MKKLIFLTSLLMVLMALGWLIRDGYASVITIYDGRGSGSGWYGAQEDDEVEPNCVTGPSWDLENFLLDGTELTMVGEYNFVNGVYYAPRNKTYISGDIFLDTAPGTPGNSWGYEYAIDLDFSTMKYNVVKLDGTSNFDFVTDIDTSNPWRWESGGTIEVSGADITYTPGTHNSVSVELNFLPEGTEFTSHFTYECGNDNLMGRGIITPEPATMILLGSGLIGLAGLARRKFFK
jgi:hypothetical protein